ncbi:MAG: hypothetical protein KKD01_08045 [Proteobacteria bacterium]|nr:hypothetical protein [Pseudomonadota bacterium]MBU1232274.1 hypothetical protein [Pseudomonadota bacterium]MBU1416955.1 hypothetical protein [Pseudomonadota bacterium]MBU1454666.1 hypothetical protein [Pseudomonadota bacterium]
MNNRIKLFTISLLLLSNGLLSAISFAVEEKPQEMADNEQVVITPKEKSFDSVEERRISTLLQNERDNLEEEKKVLALKEKELKTLQKEVDKKLVQMDRKLDELKAIQKKIDASLAKKDAEEVKKMKELSLIYAKMTPEKAARSMENLDQQLAADLLANMKIKSAAKILDQMDKAKASQLSTTFSILQVE